MSYEETIDYARLTSTLSRSRTQRLGLFFYNCLYCSTDLDILNYLSFVSHGRTRQGDSFNLLTPLQNIYFSNFVYFNRIVKLWNYVCRLASPTSFCSPNAFQLFVRKLMNNISAYLKMHRLTIILNLEPYLLRNLKVRADLRNITIHF